MGYNPIRSIFVHVSRHKFILWLIRISFGILMSYRELRAGWADKEQWNFPPGCVKAAAFQMLDQTARFSGLLRSPQPVAEA